MSILSDSFYNIVSALCTWFSSLMICQANCHKHVLLDGAYTVCAFALCFSLVLLVVSDALVGVAFLLLCLLLIFFVITLLDDDTKGDVHNDGQSG